MAKGDVPSLLRAHDNARIHLGLIVINPVEFFCVEDNGNRALQSVRY
jgi:hypothetical protein